MCHLSHVCDDNINRLKNFGFIFLTVSSKKKSKSVYGTSFDISYFIQVCVRDSIVMVSR